MDWLPTLVAAAGDPDVKEKLLSGARGRGKTFRVHLDGYNFLPYLTGETDKGPRIEFFYFSDDGDLVATRYDNWKLVFAEQRVPGHAPGLGGAVRELRVPLMFNLRTDPFERAQITSNTYYDWMLDRVYLIIPSQQVVGEFLQTFMAYPAAHEGGELHRGPGDGEDGSRDAGRPLTLAHGQAPVLARG